MSQILLTISTFLAACIRMATPLTLAGLGEAFSERTGVMNLGVEAIMLCGTFGSFMVTFWTGNVYWGMLCGMLAGMLISGIHAILCIKCKANQTIVGLALNFFALGLTSFLFLIVFGQSTILPQCKTVPNFEFPLLGKIPLLGKAFFTHNIFVYLMYLLVFIFLFIYKKTEWGVIFTAVGEHPSAADTAGINVYRIRYLACMVNGLLGGLAGSYFTLAQLGFFMEDITAGKGYIALVTVILGRRNPLGILCSALLIGLADAVQFQLQTMNIPIPSQAFSILPYIAAVFVLLFSAGKSSDPSALGIPYERDNR